MLITSAITSFDNMVSNVICLQSNEHACPSAQGCSNCVVISKAPFILRWQRKFFCRIKLILALANTYKYAFIRVW